MFFATCSNCSSAFFGLRAMSVRSSEWALIFWFSKIKLKKESGVKFFWNFGIDAVLPNLYSCKPVSATAIRIEELWKMLYFTFCFFAEIISWMWVVADKGFP